MKDHVDHKHKCYNLKQDIKDKEYKKDNLFTPISLGSYWICKDGSVF